MKAELLATDLCIREIMYSSVVGRSSAFWGEKKLGKLINIISPRVIQIE
jgi:hypothetical protein